MAKPWDICHMCPTCQTQLLTKNFRVQIFWIKYEVHLAVFFKLKKVTSLNEKIFRNNLNNLVVYYIFRL